LQHRNLNNAYWTSRHRLAALSAPLVGALSSHAPAHAFEPVDAGSLLRQNGDMSRGIGADAATPTLPEPLALPNKKAASSTENEFSFAVSEFVIDGALSNEERARVDAYLASRRGGNFTITQLQSLRDELTALLYHGGDSLVRVTLPPQTVTGGVVHFDVQRGHVEAVRVENASKLSTRRLKDILETGSGDTPSLRDIERNMRLAEEIPGVASVESMLSPGMRPGGTIVDVDVTPSNRFNGAATIDNMGSRQAGWRRLSFSGAANNLLGQGDQWQATVLGTPRLMQTRAGEDGRTRLGRVSYDMLTGLGASRAGISYAHVDYRLGDEFAGLGTGNADVATLYTTFPLVRAANARLDLGASIETRRSTDEKFDNLLQDKQRGITGSLRADGLYSGQWGDRRNASQASVVVSRGSTRQTLYDYSDDTPLSASRRFEFSKLQPSMSWTQSIAPTVQVSLAVRGQWASRSLDSSQRLGLGGPSAVRAYDQNAAAVDEGIIGTASVSIFFRALPGASMQVFYDGARGKLRDDGAFPGASVHAMQGVGIGASYSGKHVSAQVSYAMRVGQPMPNSARQQTWITVSAIV
jgi:hemolysin activation/secretion protein